MREILDQRGTWIGPKVGPLCAGPVAREIP